jgi:hypothetical protein
MAWLFGKSIARYFKWFAQSFWPGQHPGAPLGCKRLALLLFGLPALILIQLVHWLGFLLDELCFPAYRKVVVRQPVFVSGVPRSGTTFVHRTLAIDSDQFTTVSTWEAILAPSICERRILRGMAAVDRFFGRPLRKLLDWSIRRMAGDFNDIHEVDLTAPEEDYLWLLPVGGCFLLLMAFPFSPWLRQTAMLDTMDERARAELLDFYQCCIQKHLYASGRGRRFLSKNAAFTSWTSDLLRRFPDAKLLYCVREPESALSSQLSSLQAARVAFATDPSGQTTARAFIKIFAHNYTFLADCLQADHCDRDGRLAVIDQGDLKLAPGPLLAAALERLAIAPSAALSAALARHRERHRSAHQPAATVVLPPNDEIEVCLRPAYELILDAPARIRSPQ